MIRASGADMNRPSSVGWVRAIPQHRERAGSWNDSCNSSGTSSSPATPAGTASCRRGYYPRLQRPENVVHFFRDVCGDARITPAVLARRTATYRRWLDSYTEQHRIPVLTAPKGVRKEQVVAPYYRSFQTEEGVVVVLKSMEQSSTFISYEPRHTPPSGDDYRIIKRAAKRFLHYYCYVLDPIMGPMSLGVASYLPFSVNCFMNGHSYVAGELRRADVPFRMEDNAIVRCADPDLLATIADRLDERILQQRANFWTTRLTPRFSARERAKCQLHYQWSVRRSNSPAT